MIEQDAVDALAEALHQFEGYYHMERNPKAGAGSDVCDLAAQQVLAALPEGWHLQRVPDAARSTVKVFDPAAQADALATIASLEAQVAVLREALERLRNDVVAAKVSSKSPANLTNWGEVNVSLDRAEQALTPTGKDGTE